MAKKKSNKPRRSNREVALITGASGGIGEALALEFASGGYDLVLVARSKDKLEDVAREARDTYHVDATALPADLSKAATPARIYNELVDREIDVHVLVNNAGVLEMGAFADIEPARHMQLVTLNVAALTAMTTLFLEPMLERGSGKILNVASIAAFQPVPSLATYAATKAYVLSLTESLSEELKRSGVTVTALCPGLTGTDMVAQVQDKNDAAAQLPEFLISDVEAVAAEGYSACMKGEVIRVPGVINQATTLATRSAPKWLVRAVAGMVGRSAI